MNPDPAMDAFHYLDDVLHAEAVSLEAVGEAVGTPVYCYSAGAMRARARAFRAAFGASAPLVAYSVKANGNLSILRLLAAEGLGADVVSGGELHRALRAGVPPDRIVFSGVGKTRAEMRDALEAGIHQFNVESEPELAALGEAASALGVRAPTALRINPDIAAGGHAKISTGKAEDKFGIPWRRAREAYAVAAATPGIEVFGVDVHIGSQIVDLAPFRDAFQRVADLIRMLREDGIAISRVDLGGGLGVAYDAAAAPDLAAYADLVRGLFDPLGVDLILEPGRAIVAQAGALLARVVYDKPGEARRFLILDAGMNDLLRPALYDAYHEIAPVRRRAGAERTLYDVVGPVCETGDRFARERALPALQSGDLVAIMTAGAYGAALASQYNARPLAPEVLVDGAAFSIVRKRPTFEDMIALERFD